MKKTTLFSGALLLALSGLTANAQQLPNVGFEQWKTGNGNTILTATTADPSYFTRPKTNDIAEPEGWNSSSVDQSVKFGTLTIPAIFNNYEQVTENGNLHIKIKNHTGTLNQTTPGFLTLGTPWVFAFGESASMALYKDSGDGGVYGGLTFTNKPDAIFLKYMKSGATGETSRIIAYLWNGTYKSNLPSSATKDNEGGVRTYGRSCDDDARTILGREKEENVTQRGTLVASCDYELTEDKSEWTSLEVPLNYTDATTAPEKMNVIISAADFWNRGSLKGDTSMDVDDVKFVYWSRLASLTVAGESVALEDGKYTYYLSKMPATADEVAAVAKGQSASISSVTVDEESRQVTIVVTNSEGEDADGQTSHTYTLLYDPVTASYPGYLNVDLAGTPIAGNSETSITITDYQNGMCDFRLPGLTILSISLDEIVIPRCTVEVDASGMKTYNGSITGLGLTMNGQATGIFADVTLAGGTIDANNKVVMPVNVIWQTYPIDVLFSSEKKVDTADGYYFVVKDGDYQNPLVEKVNTTLSVTPATVDDPNNPVVYTLQVADVQFTESGSTVDFGDLTVDGASMSKAGLYSASNVATTLKGGQQATVSVSDKSTGAGDEKKYEVKFDVTVGETVYTVVFTTDMVSAGVDSVAAGKATVYGAEGAIVVAGFDGKAEVYTVDGKLVATGNGSISAAPGLYIVRAGQTVTKVVVK